MKVRDEAYQYYFYFVQERMNIFWKRYNGGTARLTDDIILVKHKFTNVYRAQDRVSQYLINNVIYNQTETFTDLDILLRIVVFKIFNNIDTWIFLESRYGVISYENFDVKQICRLLTQRIQEKPIFSAAYMMTGSHQKYNMFDFKHEKWLSMVENELIKEKRFDKILDAKSLQEVYDILISTSFIGPFIAYQYAIDINYSNAINFDENSFVKAGIGSIRGIQKCFPDKGKKSFEDCIRFTQDNFQKFQERYGYTKFKNLFDRPPQLIDLQNCFCETDKYLRVKIPELLVGNIRIKQKFTHPKDNNIQFFFPPKWGINHNIKPCVTKNSQESIPF